jgi:UDP-glucose 4-epimerase
MNSSWDAVSYLATEPLHLRCQPQLYSSPYKGISKLSRFVGARSRAKALSCFVSLDFLFFSIMDFRSTSGAYAPSPSLCDSSAKSTSDFMSSDSTGTPLTSSSSIFDHVSIPPLDLSHHDEEFILVVGGLGYIGSHTTLELLKAGYNVVAVDNLSNSYREVLEKILVLASEHCRLNNKSMPALKFHEADYKSPVMRSILMSYCLPAHRTPEDEKVCHIKGVIHFAAHKAVEESISKPIPYYMNNVCGMVSFLSLLQEFGIKNFVFSSSATVYGIKANEGMPLKEEYLVHEPETFIDYDGLEKTQQSGVFGLTSPYGRTKWMCEAILADVAKSDPSWSITALRYFNPVGCDESGILGEDPRQTPTNLVPVVIQVLTGAKERLEIMGTDWNTYDGTTIRDYIHVIDLAKGHIAALAAAAKGNIKEPFRAYNLGTGTGHTVREVVRSLEKVSSTTIPAVEVGRRPGDIGFCVAGVDRATNELEWKAEKTLDDCCRDIWNFTSKSKNRQPAPAIQKVKTPESKAFTGPKRVVNPRTAFHMSLV